MEQNESQRLIKLAQKRYNKDVTITCLVSALLRERQTFDLETGHTRLGLATKAGHNVVVDTLAGYERGIKGEEGYSHYLEGIDTSLLDRHLRRQAALIRFTALMNVLAASLETLGEEVNY